MRLVYIVVAALFVSSVFPVKIDILASDLQLEWDSVPALLFNDGEGFYDYAPSSLLVGNTEYHYFCTNKEPFIVADHIGLIQIDHGTRAVLKGKQIVLSPSLEGWDEQHVCDPAIVKGRFSFGGTTYSWAMFYTGEDYTDIPCTHNQIGVAFAKQLNGPWVKWEGNPIIRFDSYGYWGVGQPCVTSIDGAGRMLLFYSRGDASGTRVVRRELNLSDMDAPFLGPEVPLPTAGLSARDWAGVIFHNASLAYDPSRDMFFVVRPQHPFDSEMPNFVSTELPRMYSKIPLRFLIYRPL